MEAVAVLKLFDVCGWGLVGGWDGRVKSGGGWKAENSAGESTVVVVVIVDTR
jgi:hypothetical protein